MTPFELNILLHYYASPTDPEVFKRNPPILAETLVAFIECDLMREKTPEDSEDGTYRLTERGDAYIKHVLAVPLPVVKWVLPEAPDVLDWTKQKLRKDCSL